MPITAYVSSKVRTGGPDPGLVRDQLISLQNLFKVYGAELFCEQLLWILRKNPEEGSTVTIPNKNWNRRLIPFRLNKIQRDIENRKRNRNICLKGRQGGYTVFFILRRLLLPAILEPGTGGLLLSQTNSYATKHFDIMRRGYRYFGAVDPSNSALNELTTQLHENLLHLRLSNRRELIFDQLDSMLVCDSAEVSEAGQGLTLQHAVCSEVSRWPGKPEETLANMKEAIPSGGTLDIECTANGMGGYFFEECMRSRDPANISLAEFQYFFHEWFWTEEYRDKESAKVDSLTDEEKTLREKCHLDLKQIMWRRKKIVSLRHEFPEKYPEDDISCFLVQGRAFFDMESLRYRLMELTNYKPVASYRKGTLKIFRKPIKGRWYVIGADPATGREVSSIDEENKTDFCAAVVLDGETGEEVASYRARIPPEEFAFDLADLGRKYNDALIAVERTGDGSTVLLTLQVQCGYGNLYEHRDWYKKDRTKTVIEVLGFPTTPKTRPYILNKLAQFVRDEPELFWDATFIAEASTFVRNEKGIPAATPGAHDDTVLCRAIAHGVRLIRTGFWDPAYTPREKYGQTA